MTRPDPRADLDEIRRALALLYERDEVGELRVPKTRHGTQSGYFRDHQAMATAAARLSGSAGGVYVTLNPVAPALLARAHNRVKERVAVATNDTDILRRRWLLLDFDAVRPVGISSTDAEHEAALAVARSTRTWLVETLDFPADGLVIADSGNGSHVLIRVDLPNDDATRSLVQRCLEAVALHCGTDTVQVDTSVGNAARIAKLPGTLAAKGDPTSDRPHRIARLLEVPPALVIVPLALLERLAALRPEEPARGRSTSATRSGNFDLRAWLAGHGLTIVREKAWVNGGTVLELAECGFTGAHEHHRGEAAVILCASGMLLYTCQHNTCVGRKWDDLRTHLDGPRGHARRVGTAAPREEAPWPDAPSDTEPDGVSLVPLDTIPPASVRWAWDGRIPLGAVTLLVGDGGLGKSTMLLDVAARLSRGQLAGVLYGAPSAVAVATAEDAVAEVVRPRAETAGADLALVQVIKVRRDGTPDGLILPADVVALQTVVRAARVRMVNIDPLVAHLPETVNAHRDQDVRRALAPLVRLAEQEDVAVVAVVHLNKSDSTKVVTRICASVGFHNAARSVLLVGPDPEDRDGPTRVLVHAKCNLAPHAPALRFRIEGRELVVDGTTIKTSGIAWCGEATGVSSAQVLGTPDAEKESALSDAVAWLREALTDTPVEAGTLIQRAKAVGIAERTLRRARQLIGATTRKEEFGGSWVWSLAEAATHEAIPPPMAPLAPSFSHSGHRSSEEAKGANTYARAREAASSDRNGDTPPVPVFTSSAAQTCRRCGGHDWWHDAVLGDRCVGCDPASARGPVQTPVSSPGGERISGGPGMPPQIPCPRCRQTAWARYPNGSGWTCGSAGGSHCQADMVEAAADEEEVPD